MSEKKLHLIGCASGVAGVDPQSGTGPLCMQKSPFLEQLKNKQLSFQWDHIFYPPQETSSLLFSVQDVCTQLAKGVSQQLRNDSFFTVVGGDHSCAIGTWSGVYDALHTQGDIGLIWIDAHMDSHTPETSESGRIHGMPLAALMGFGFPELTNILHAQPKLKPENVCLIGVRSFERGEAELLKRLNVRIYFMNEVKERGFVPVLREAVKQVSRNTIGYGISLDVDGIDPIEAPGVDVPEPDGIHISELFEGFNAVISDPKLIATEVVEFDPSRDQKEKTEKIIAYLLAIFAQHRG